METTDLCFFGGDHNEMRGTERRKKGERRRKQKGRGGRGRGGVRLVSRGTNRESVISVRSRLYPLFPASDSKVTHQLTQSRSLSHPLQTSVVTDRACPRFSEENGTEGPYCPSQGTRSVSPR